MKDYAEKQNLNIIYDWKVTRIKREDCKHKNDKHKSVFILQNTRGDEVRCHVLLMATGQSPRNYQILRVSNWQRPMGVIP